MFDLIPWLDETYIVEMGRLFLCGGDSDSILMGGDGTILRPLCYIGPLIQELSYRLFGEIGVRISPFVALFISGFAFYRKTKSVIWGSIVATSPLLFQSALLTRVDCWSIAFMFLSWSFWKNGKLRHDWYEFAGAAFFAVLSLLTWPTAMLFALVYFVISAEDFRFREIVGFFAFGLGFATILITPLAPIMPQYFESFSRHYGEVTHSASSITDVVMPIAREVARSPFLSVLSIAGLVLWCRRRKYLRLGAFAVALVVAAISGLYTFRLIYLLPFLYWAGFDASVRMKASYPQATRAFLWMTLAYGLLTGFVGHFALDYPRLPKDLKHELGEIVGVGPVRVFSPDHATYYIGRDFGWKQLGFAKPSDLNDSEVLNKAISSCDYVILRDFDSYETFQQSCTPYGLFCKYVLSRAKAERDLPNDEKSWAARFGSSFAFAWHKPIDLKDFVEVAKFDMIRVYSRRVLNN